MRILHGLRLLYIGDSCSAVTAPLKHCIDHGTGNDKIGACFTVGPQDLALNSQVRNGDIQLVNVYR